MELGQLEPMERRGQILATGQMIRYTFNGISGLIQALLVNGPATSPPDCPISAFKCWSWGLSVNQYYGLLFALVFILTIPVWFLKELDATHIPLETASHHVKEIWSTLQNLTTLYLLVFVIGIGIFTNFQSNVNTYMQYYIIQLTNFQAGIIQFYYRFIYN